MSNTRNNMPRDIWRLPTVIAKTGYGRSSLYAFMKEGTFPQCRRIGPRAVGWDSLEVQDWIDSKLGGQH